MTDTAGIMRELDRARRENREQAAEIERLKTRLSGSDQLAEVRYQEIERLQDKIKRLRALSQNNAHSWDTIVKERNELRDDNERLRTAGKKLEALYTGACKDAERDLCEIERLTAAVQRIDGINDNPADYNSEINAVCDTILRPHLAAKDKP